MLPRDYGPADRRYRIYSAILGPEGLLRIHTATALFAKLPRLACRGGEFFLRGLDPTALRHGVQLSPLWVAMQGIVNPALFLSGSDR